jgi:hypothetical protein
MSSSLVPEKPLLIYPSLAATLGLEESLLLCTLADCSSNLESSARGQFQWFELPMTKLLTLLPFWDLRDLQRIATHLREQGVIIFGSEGIRENANLRFAFNERVQQQIKPNVVRTQTTEAAPPDTRQTAAEKESNYFLSRNFIPASWQPDQSTLDQLAQHAIPEVFCQQHVPEFVTYWRERKERHHSWGSKFIQHCLRKWRDYEAERAKKQQEQPLHANWTPSLDALEILTERAGISREFVEDAVPEFVLYWRERGESHRTWNSKFVQHVRIQWAKYTAAIEHNTNPRPIPEDWQPSRDVCDVLQLANIDLSFARSLIPEFVLYWRDRGVLIGSWNTKYLQHVKRMWAQRHTLPTATNRNTRDISLEEQLSDRSWAQ